jgi:hypothetical protein
MRDEFGMKRRRALASCVGMTFPEHALMQTII